MIAKSGDGFSEKIMLEQRVERDDFSTRSHPALGSRQHDAVDDRAPVAGRGGEDEGVPDGVLESQPAPDVEIKPAGKKKAPKGGKNKGEGGKGRRPRMDNGAAAPAGRGG